jgi:zinc-binding alcohol dehydrogenase family protein
MKAVGYHAPHPIAHPEALLDLDLPAPEPQEHDLLVRVQAISVNPVDLTQRAGVAPADGAPKVLGWDAVGTVQAVGSAVTGFAVGDRVYYAGSIDRPGTNAELHAVDARIAAHAPATLSDAQAAALPLTAITAWEILFDRLRLSQDNTGETLLVVGGAGGVGSILVQLARQLTGLRVVATASRPETRQWCLDMGAHHVVSHHRPLAPQLATLGLAHIDHVASLTHTAEYMGQYVECLRPQGQIAVIDDMPALDVVPLKRKSLSLHWEMMFTRPLFHTPDMARQSALLAEVARLVDAGRLRSTLAAEFGAINAANLRRAHAHVESGQAIGKVVLQGF